MRHLPLLLLAWLLAPACSEEPPPAVEIPKCDDGEHNGSETDVDCGGTCPACELGQGCLSPADCVTGECAGGICSLCGDGVRNGRESDVDCGGGCAQCGLGKHCNTWEDCLGGRCDTGRCEAPASCGNHQQDNRETDVDCGGAVCPSCPAGKSCRASEDCQSGTCLHGFCREPSCTDGIRNQGEIDIDCGGPCERRCGDGRACVAGTDCASGSCRAGVCDPSCGLANGGCDPEAICTNTPTARVCACKEGFGGTGLQCSDVDECKLGMDDCDPHATCTNREGGYRCACLDGYSGDGKTCEDVNECTTARHDCAANAECANTEGGFTCTCPSGFEGDGKTCTDTDECAQGIDDCSAEATCTDLEGSFSCRCNQGFEGDGRTCADVNECLEGGARCDAHARCSNTRGGFDCICEAGWVGDGTSCALPPPSCTNGVQDGAETAIDCGGSACPRCGTAAVCGAPADCLSGVCTDGRCVACVANGIQDALESDVDCGEGCVERCESGERCAAAADCESGSCRGGFCDPSCATANGGCSANASCVNAPEGRTCTCKEGFTGDGLTCVSHCSNGEQDGDETDTDCGGSCEGCEEGEACEENADCLDESCVDDVCRKPTCFDGLQNQGEVDTDCAGPCAKRCDAGQACGAAGDCASGSCRGGACDPSCADGNGGCDANAVCTNTPTARTCACKEGYSGDGLVCLKPCEDADGSGTAATNVFADGSEQATVSITSEGCQRSYSLETNIALRDNLPGNPRAITEQAGWPTVRTRNQMFDALYALALEEVRENSVSQIQDGSFNGGSAIACPAGGCFETGRKWKYVWTRDTSYAVNLGLAPLDPVRARNSLEFKLSERRAGGDLQIVQDTGTGGSYPISTDRVVWALGAWEVLKFLQDSERTAFRDRAFEALSNTLAHDREVIYDPADGLYRGESSFLDWREQTYPAWMKDEPVHIGVSKSLSTNLLHLQALRIAALLAEENGNADARARYQTWADALAAAIHDKLWLADEGLYAAYLTTTLDPAPVHRYDLLGEALAVLTGVAAPERAAQVLASYPHAGKGPAVIWPQQQATRIYHNRAIWPFVTAYWLKAAQKARNDAVADFAVWSLMRGAALNLSNMENFEAITGKNCLEEGGKGCENDDPGTTSGPRINSQRQLWSVGGYLSMVHDVVFGLDTSQTGIRFRPYVTRAMRDTLFANAETLVLNRFPYQGKHLTVVVHFPGGTSGTGGAFVISETRLDGMAVGEGYIAPAELAAHSRLDVYLVEGTEAAASMRQVQDTANYRNLFGPKTPAITALTQVGGKVQLTLDRAGEVSADVTFNVYRDGALIRANLPGSTTTWIDEASTDSATRTHCYTVETVFASGNRSQHAAPSCFWGPSYERTQTWDARTFQANGGELVLEYGKHHYRNWGEPQHTLTATVQTKQAGRHFVQVLEGNGGSVSTGITCGVKRVRVEDATSGALVAGGVLLMPHLGSWSVWKDSNLFPVTLEANKSYRVVVDGAEPAVNMSFFRHFETYNGTGGASGSFNRTNIAEVKLLAIGE